MNTENYPSEQGISYKIFHSAVGVFQNLYQGEAKQWVIDQNIASAGREKTVGQCEHYFNNLTRSLVGNRT